MNKIIVEITNYIIDIGLINAKEQITNDSIAPIVGNKGKYLNIIPIGLTIVGYSNSYRNWVL